MSTLKTASKPEPIKNATIQNKSETSSGEHHVCEGLIHRNLEQAAKTLNIAPVDLQYWVNQHRAIPPAQLIHCLKLITQFTLDPFTHEISLLPDERGADHYFIHIAIDGWIKILNNQAKFDGFEIEESTEYVGNVPVWIACSIYRKDRKVPIRIKEYFSELKTEHEVWATTPYKMLRNRTIASCARIAFGVAVSEPFAQIKIDKNPAVIKTAPNSIPAEKIGQAPSATNNRVQVLKNVIGAIQDQKAKSSGTIS
jgi:hypothetical protein